MQGIQSSNWRMDGRTDGQTEHNACCMLSFMYCSGRWHSDRGWLVGWLTGLWSQFWDFFWASQNLTVATIFAASHLESNKSSQQYKNLISFCGFQVDWLGCTLFHMFTYPHALEQQTKLLFKSRRYFCIEAQSHQKIVNKTINEKPQNIHINLNTSFWE